MEKITIDAADRRILAALQRDASLSLADLSAAVGLSPTPCWKRVKRMTADGIINRRVALLDLNRLGLGATVFVAVRTNPHDEQWLQDFARSEEHTYELQSLISTSYAVFCSTTTMTI